MPKGHGEKLSRRKEQALAALLHHSTIKAAAEAVGVNEKTLRVWMANPDFLRAYRAARSQLVENAVAQMQRAAGAAVAVLTGKLTSEKDVDVIKAALGIYDRSVRGVELLDLLERVEALEQAAKAEKDQS